MSVTVPPRNIAGSLQNRQARPLNGLEISESIEKHFMVLTDRMLNESGLLSDEIILVTEGLKDIIREELNKQSRLQRMNITYPKVGWSIKTRLERKDDYHHVVNGEVELDLERNVRLNLRFGESGQGIVIKSLEEEKISTSVPDKDRQQFNLPIEAEYIKPDGTTGKVDITELKPTEKRAARTVDVGSGASNKQVRWIQDGSDLGKKVEVSGGQQGDVIITPSELPEITLDDLVATPPEIPKEPPTNPLPPKGSMAQVTKPGVKFKGGK